ncbi:MAG: tripartite tricarboxylate transporter substrate binding protein [Thermodesulfobacteriota bacterium]
MKTRGITFCLVTVFFLISFLLVQPAIPAEFPSKPVTLICAYAPGGTADIVMRTLAETTSKYLGQPVVVENKGGGGGTLGPTTMAATARSDGYTVSQMPVTMFRNPHLMKATWDIVKDFTYIIHLSGYTFGVVVKANAPWKNWDEFIAYAKANPGKVSYNSPGTYSTPHIVMELIAKERGIKWIHVPTKGGGEETPEVLGGHVTASCNSTGGFAGQVDSGDLRLLVTWGEKRTKRWPAVPTLKDLGYGIVSTSSFGITGPRDMDPKIVKILHDSFKKGMEDPAFLKVLDRLDMPSLYMNSQDYARYSKQLFEEEKINLERIGFMKK